MIVSASRRTDIPAFYSKWFMNRVRAGFCSVPNPFNPKQISVVSLRPDDVEAIVFWTKNPKPMLDDVRKLESLGLRFYFQFTLNDYPKDLEPSVPSKTERIETFQRLSDLLGPKRVVWRYDPIIISNKTNIDFHKRAFEALCVVLSPFTKRIMVSIVDLYKKTERAFGKLESAGWRFGSPNEVESVAVELLKWMSRVAKRQELEIFTCAEAHNYSEVGVPPGKCVDDDLIKELWGIRVSWNKDKGQRKECGCVESREIGINDTCRHGCKYCYATQDLELSCRLFKEHDPQGTALIGSPSPKTGNRSKRQQELFK